MSLLPGAGAPVWVLAPGRGCTSCQLRHPPPPITWEPSQASPGFSAFSRERVYHTLWLHLGLQSSGDHATTISRHGPPRTHCPQTFTKHTDGIPQAKPRDFSLPPLLTSWGTWMPGPSPAAILGPSHQGHSLGPSASFAFFQELDVSRLGDFCSRVW